MIKNKDAASVPEVLHAHRIQDMVIDKMMAKSATGAVKKEIYEKPREVSPKQKDVDDEEEIKRKDSLFIENIQLK
jgi:hypothetical protein